MSSAGGAEVAGTSWLAAAHGNSNAAAVLRALAAGICGSGGDSEEPATPSAGEEAEASPTPLATAPEAEALPAAEAEEAEAVAAPSSESSDADAVDAPLVDHRWAFHLASLSSMGFADADANTALLYAYDGNLMRVVNALLEGAIAAQR